MVRAGEQRALVEASFDLSDENTQSIHQILEREALMDESKILTLGREIRSNGRSFARVNGRNVNNHLLIELSEFLVDVHGQSEHLSLLHVKQHLGLLDRYAHVERDVADYQDTYHRSSMSVANSVSFMLPRRMLPGRSISLGIRSMRLNRLICGRVRKMSCVQNEHAWRMRKESPR